MQPCAQFETALTYLNISWRLIHLIWLFLVLCYTQAQDHYSFLHTFTYVLTVWPQPIWIKVKSWWQILPQHQSTYQGGPESVSIEILLSDEVFENFMKWGLKWRIFLKKPEKTEFVKIPNSQSFFAKISQIDPWYSRTACFWAYIRQSPNHIG